MLLSTTREYLYNTKTLSDSHFTYILFQLSRIFSYHTRTHYYFLEFLSYNFQFIIVTYNYGNHGYHRERFSDSSQQKEKGLRITFSLPPASQPTTLPSNCKNKPPLIATGIDPKFNTPIKIMSKLRQYHPNLRVLKIKQTENGWILIGDTPKDFAILQSEPKMQHVSKKKSLPKSYHSADAKRKRFWFSREYLTT